MREEIEAAVTFLTRLLAKSSMADSGAYASLSTASASSTTNSSNGSITNNSIVKDNNSLTSAKNHNSDYHYNNNNHHIHHQSLTEEKIKKFSQKLIDILTQRYQNHWYPGQPSKGQAYRCIRINQNCRVDCSIELACQHVGISYESLRLPVELTLWIDPSEVTCRFGEHKGSFCIVAKLGDGRQENFAESINIDELEQRSLDRSKQPFENSRMKMKINNHGHVSQQRQMTTGHHVSTSAKQVAAVRQQAGQSPSMLNVFSSSSVSSGSNMNNQNVSYHTMNGNAVQNLTNGLTSQHNNHHMNSHCASPVGSTLANGFGVDYAAMSAAATNGLPVFGPVSAGTATSGLPFGQATSGTAGGGSTSQTFQFPPNATQFFNTGFHPPQVATAAANFQHHNQHSVAVLHNAPGSWSPNTTLIFGTSNNAGRHMSALSSSTTNHPSSSTPPTSVGGGGTQLQVGTGGPGRSSLSQNHLSSSPLAGGNASSASSSAFRSGQVNNSLPVTVISTSSSVTLPVSSTCKSSSQQLSSNHVLTNGSLAVNNSNANSSNNANNGNVAGGANPNAPVFVSRYHPMSQFNLSAAPFTPASLANTYQQSIDQQNNNGSSLNSTKDRRTFAIPSSVATPPSTSGTSVPTAAATPIIANNRF